MTNNGTEAVFRTNKNAPNYKLISIDLLDYGQEKWVDLLPEHPKNVLHWASAVDEDKFVACYIQDVKVYTYTRKIFFSNHDDNYTRLSIFFCRMFCNYIV